jgi:hypothetical protein
MDSTSFSLLNVYKKKYGTGYNNIVRAMEVQQARLLLLFSRKFGVIFNARYNRINPV